MQEYMDAELFADFIIEAREHLETIEPALLELEKNPGNTDLLNDIFRPMHSLKGASGFLGLAKINGLAHKAENILDELRNEKMVVTSEIMDLIFSATDVLTSIIDNLDTDGDEGDVETAHIIERIEALLSGGCAPQDVLDVAKSQKQAAAQAAQQAAEQEAVPEEAAEPKEPYKLTVVGDAHLVDFLEEARDLLKAVGDGLLELEKDPEGNDDMVNDLFRYYHNLKGNCGIIGFTELSELTHEAETLLGRVRKHEMQMNAAMVDVLLAAGDAMEDCLQAVNEKELSVIPVDVSAVVTRLQKATNGEFESQEGAETQAAESQSDEDSGSASEDHEIFLQTVSQQLKNIDLALEKLSEDSEQKEYVDGLHRSLTSVQNSANYMHFEDLATLAERTAGLVAQARDTDMDFGMMVDILKQECSILKDSVFAEVEKAKASNCPTPEPVETAAPAAQPKEPAPQEAAPEPVAEEPVVEKQAAPEPQKPEAKASPAEKPAANQEAKPDAKSEEKAKAKTSATIRVDHDKLDHLMNVIGELIINRNRFTMIARSLEEGSVNTAEVAQSLSETTDAMARISDDLQDTIMKVRMVQVSSVFSRFPRLVRDLSRKAGKQVELVTEGEDTELDKSLIEEIGDPLVHLVRNSLDHGLEPPEERETVGKPKVGKVWLRAYHKGNSVAIEIEDDGRGINPEKMRTSAVKKGLKTEEEAAALSDREAIELIFAPGFSTAEKITDISGRGVGMDVVRTNIKNLKGNVNVESTVGKGTKFTLSLPLTLAIIDALMINIGDDTFAIPLDAVSETTKIEAKDLTEMAGAKAITLRGDVLGVAVLRDLLDESGQVFDPIEDREILPMVVIQENGKRLGLIVDRLLERQEIVIKPLGEYLKDFDLRGMSGATIMGDGSVVLILDPHEIHAMATHSQTSAV